MPVSSLEKLKKRNVCTYFFIPIIRISIAKGRKGKALPISLRLNAASTSSGMPFQDSPIILGKPGSMVFLSSSYLFTAKECKPSKRPLQFPQDRYKSFSAAIKQQCYKRQEFQRCIMLRFGAQTGSHPPQSRSRRSSVLQNELKATKQQRFDAGIIYRSTAADFCSPPEFVTRKQVGLPVLPEVEGSVDLLHVAGQAQGVQPPGVACLQLICSVDPHLVAWEGEFV